MKYQLFFLIHAHYNINHPVKSFGNWMNFVLCYNPIEQFDYLVEFCMSVYNLANGMNLYVIAFKIN